MKLRIAALLGLLASVALAGTTHDLHLAARDGDLAGVKRLVGAGVDIDAADAWGTTALSLATKTGQLEVVRYLLAEGADPSARESFFGMSVLDLALWKGEPDYAAAKLLLEAGAKDRARALEHALETDDVALARAASASGPITETEAADLRARFTALDRALAEVFAAQATVPDPPPPRYSSAELARFAGHFTGREATSADVAVHGAGLKLTFAGETYELVAFAEREFRDREAGVKLSLFGRAGTVEGISIERRGEGRIRLGQAEEPLAAWEPPAPRSAATQPAASPTVHWPGFRGANRAGVGDGLEPPTAIDLASGEGVAWRAPLPGLGNSSPVVWGDRIYVTTAVAEGGSVPLKVGRSGSGDEIEESREHRWLVLAFDKADGRKLWETEVGRAVPLTRRHFKATQANSTPVTDGEHLVVVFPTAGMACLGRDGTIHWKRDLGGLNAGGFNDPGMQWGFAASPILHRGKVILQVDIHGGAYLAAWDLKTGKRLWKTERPDVAPSWATPAIWPTPTGEQLVANASIIRGYDPETGRELWSLGPTSIQVVASPVVGDELLFVSSGYPPARPIYAVKPGIAGAHDIATADDTAALAWHRTRGGAYMPTPLLYRGLLYIVHHNGRIVAHDARTGEPVRRVRLSAGGTCTSSPVAANGRLYVGTEEGTLYVLAAGAELAELAVHELGAPLMATPAISEGILLVRTPSELLALGRGDEPP